MKYDFYVASGWFNTEQEIGRQLIIDIAKDLGLTYFSPKDELICPPDAPLAAQQDVFDVNILAIRSCKFVVVNTAGKDLGTIFEAGASYILGKPIIYVCLGLKGNFNLMLSRSGVAVATNAREIQEHLAAIQKDINYKKEYVGKIE